MRLTRLEIRDVRCVGHALLQPSARLNLICGPNGSGKTTLLEAIHLLGTARSFRTHLAGDVVKIGQPTLRVVARISRPDGRVSTVGIERSRSSTTIRLDGRTVRSASDLAASLPLVLITPDSHALIGGGPRERRRLMDWTLFHVKPNYLADWQRYYRGLKQRNALLRRRTTRQACRDWEGELAVAAERLHEARAKAADALSGHLETYSSVLLDARVTLRYEPGWEIRQTLEAALDDKWEGDCALGSTRVGPHRAEIVFTVDGQPAARILSRGQAKLLVVALALAQARVLRDATGDNPVFLVDDLPAELDPVSRGKFLGMLDATGAQVFVTSTEPGLISLNGLESQVFHVKQGEVIAAAA